MVKQMIAAVQVYIHHMKGVEVNIIPNLPYDMPKLLHAYQIAKDWCDENLIQ